LHSLPLPGFTVADFTAPTKKLLPNFPVAQFSVAQFTANPIVFTILGFGIEVQPQRLRGCSRIAMVVKDIRLYCIVSTVMFDDFLHQLVSGSLPSYGWRFNVGEHRKPWEGCRPEGTTHRRGAW